MGDTSIQWTDKTWTPLRARVKADAAAIAEARGYTSLVYIAGKMAGHVGPHCEHVSPGCELCYSGTNNGRCLPSNGTGLPFDRRARDLVDPFVDEKILQQPLHWRTPSKVFVCSQTDLFGEWVTDEAIDRVFAVMALCPQHTFQILTKRPARMWRYLNAAYSFRREQVRDRAQSIQADWCFPKWPLPNIWLGISCEDQATADERIPLLLQTPAAVRFVSYEPALGPVDFDDERDWLTPSVVKLRDSAKLDWVIVGGESGPGARPFDIQWALDTIAQCKSASVACFVKQLGAHPFMTREADGAFCPDWEFNFSDRKGGDWSEWPEDLRVREFPEARQEAHA